MHNFLLRYYLAEAGLNPDTDAQRRVVPPADMVTNLRADNIDGFLGPDPFNQRAVYEEVGFLHLPTKDIWNGYPCCAFGTSTEFIQKNPNTTDAKKRMKELGQMTPDGAYPKFSVMGQEFDAAKAEQYATGFAIDKMG